MERKHSEHPEGYWFGFAISRCCYEANASQSILVENHGIIDEEILVKMQHWLDVEKERFRDKFRQKF